MKLYIISKFNDGHLAITTYITCGKGGNAKQRKRARRHEEYEKLSRVDRQIIRDSVLSPIRLTDTIEITPFGTPNDNEDVAARFISEAAAIISQIEAAIGQFAVTPSKPLRVVLEARD